MQAKDTQLSEQRAAHERAIGEMTKQHKVAEQALDVQLQVRHLDSSVLAYAKQL